MKRNHNESSDNDYAYKNNNKDNTAAAYAAKSVLNKYFNGISQSNFHLSYELITEIDKKRITKNEFIIWQGSVSKIFHLEEYSIRPCTMSVTGNNRMGEHGFSDMVRFNVNVIEYNIVMDMPEMSSFTKITVLENKKWRVYLGYENLQPLIKKFKSLSGLLTAKTVINELVETQNRIDALTGLLNKRGIFERIEGEVLRYNRYGNIFSIVMGTVAIKGSLNPDVRLKIEERAIKAIGEILVNSLRELDIVGRYEKNSFLILLPETGGASAHEAVKRLNIAIKDVALSYKSSLSGLSVKFKTAEYSSSIDETLNKII